MTPTLARSRTSYAFGGAVAAAGLGLLLVRGDVAHSTGLLTLLFAAVLLAGLLPAIACDTGDRSVTDPIPALLLGLVAFAAGRLIGGGHPLLPATLPAIARNTLAAVAEEALFRRLLFALVAARYSATLAVATTGVVFALIHVPLYGWWVVPLDLAAGLILGWQRAATGSWFVPAATHAAANLLVVL